MYVHAELRNKHNHEMTQHAMPSHPSPPPPPTINLAWTFTTQPGDKHFILVGSKEETQR